MMTALIRSLAVLAFLSLSGVHADSSIHTLQLKHRLASEVLPQIEAFLPPTATVRAFEDTLILKSDRATLANVQQLLEKLDTPLQNVLITVMRSNHVLDDQRGGSTQIGVEAADDVRASVGINRWSTHGHLDDNQQYRARGIAGQPVSINLGEMVPQQQQLVFLTHHGIAVEQQTRYISTTNGFQALPYLLANQQVRVEIHPFFSKLSRVDHDIRSSEVISSVSGQLGEWLEIGRIENSATLNNDGVTTYRSQEQQNQILYLKIELSN